MGWGPVSRCMGAWEHLVFTLSIPGAPEFGAFTMGSLFGLKLVAAFVLLSLEFFCPPFFFLSVPVCLPVGGLVWGLPPVCGRRALRGHAHELRWREAMTMDMPATNEHVRAVWVRKAQVERIRALIAGVTVMG